MHDGLDSPEVAASLSSVELAKIEGTGGVFGDGAGKAGWP